MASKTVKPYEKNGYRYRQEKGGKRVFRIGKVEKKAAPAPLGQRVAKDPNLLQRALRDPGLRSKLPDKYLTPAQREARQTNEFNRQIGDVSTPLTGDAMVNASQRLVRMEYDPQYKNLDAEEKKVTASGKQQASWAAGYDRDAQAIMDANKTAQQNANAATEANMRQLAQQAGVGATAQLGAGQQAAAMDMGVRGAGLGGGTQAVAQPFDRRMLGGLGLRHAGFSEQVALVDECGERALSQEGNVRVKPPNRNKRRRRNHPPER